MKSSRGVSSHLSRGSATLRTLAIGSVAPGGANSIVTSFWRSIIMRIGILRYIVS